MITWKLPQLAAIVTHGNILRYSTVLTSFLADYYVKAIVYVAAVERARASALNPLSLRTSRRSTIHPDMRKSFNHLLRAQSIQT